MNNFLEHNRLLQKLLLRLRPAILATFLKKILGIKRVTVDAKIGSFCVDPISNFGVRLIESGEYEPDMYQTLQYFLKPSNIFLDVGANEGYFCVAGAKFVGVSGKVIGVEPQRRLQPILSKNFELNQVENVTIVNSAISNIKGSAEIHISPDTNTGSTSLHQSTKYKLPTDTVQTILLSELFTLAGIEHADLVKMDIEGFEYEAILGSQELFKEQKIKVLALELHPSRIKQRGLDPDEIEHFLKNCGYQLSERFDNTVWTILSD